MTSSPSAGGEVLFGVKAIADFLAIPIAQAQEGIEAGRIPAWRAGTGYCASVRELAVARVLRHARAS